MLNKAFYILLFCFVVALNPLYAQEYAKVTGTLTDEENNPLFSASIGIKENSTGTVSDEKGKFEFVVPANEKFTLVISYLGYDEVSLTLTLKPGETYTLNQKLTPVSRQLDDVVVYNRFDRTNTLVRIDIKSIDQIPSVSGDFESLLKTLPGVSSSNELSSQYSVRGGNFDENLVYVNDIEIYRPFLIRSSQQEGLSFINSDMISSIQFSAGGFDAMYGDKMSSVLDIKYSRPTEFGGSLSASMLGAAAHVEGISKNRRFTLNSGIRYKTTQYLLGTLETTGDYKPSFLDFQTFLTYDISKKLEINFLGNISLNKFQLIPETRSTNFGTYQEALNLTIFYEGQEIDQFDNYMGAVSINYRPSDKLSLKLIGSAFRSLEDVRYDILGQYWINLLDNVVGSETQGDSILNIGVGTILDHGRNFLDALIYAVEHKGSFYSPNNNLKWGLKYQIEDIRDNLNTWEYLDSAGYSLPYSDGDVNLYKASRSKNHLYSSRITAYIQNTFNFSPGSSDIFLTAGIRTNYWDYNNTILISPRASVSINPHWEKNFTFHFATGYYYQPPFYKELRDPEGILHTNPKAQKSVHYVLGSDLKFTAWSRPFIFTAEVYYKNLSQLIPYKVENVRVQYLPEFTAKGYAAGIEFKVNGEFVKDAESWVSLSIMQTKEDALQDYYISNDGTTVFPGYYRRPTDQLINFGLFFQDYLPNNPGYKVHLSILYSTSLPYGSPDYKRPSEIYELGAYNRVDIGFSKALKKESSVLSDSNPLRWFKNVWISAEIFNLFGVKNKASYDWVRTVNNQAGLPNMFAVPNYLTGRRINVKLSAKF
ncbi:MAG: carboxypeptidase-like regulatory domain-containing protein [Bacteroidales bacterium]|nr:carboxypeptidase-like regulatory domain-containing protein [Bacteroidales bacterium]